MVNYSKYKIKKTSKYCLYTILNELIIKYSDFI